MAYTQLPASVFLALTTNGVANTDTTHTLVAAPGVGQRLRVSALGYSYAPANTGVVELRSGLAGNLFFGLDAGPTGPGAELIIPEPGYALAGNQALTGISRSNVITQAFRVWVYYYTELLS
jgi:hypothetical protein